MFRTKVLSNNTSYILYSILPVFHCFEGDRIKAVYTWPNVKVEVLK